MMEVIVESEGAELVFVIIRDSSGVVEAYIEDDEVPIRMAPGDTCLARGEIILADEQEEVLRAIDTPLFRRNKETMDRVSKENIRELLCAALVAGFQSKKKRALEHQRS